MTLGQASNREKRTEEKLRETTAYAAGLARLAAMPGATLYMQYRARRAEIAREKAAAAHAAAVQAVWHAVMHPIERPRYSTPRRKRIK